MWKYHLIKKTKGRGVRVTHCIHRFYITGKEAVRQWSAWPCTLFLLRIDVGASYTQVYNYSAKWVKCPGRKPCMKQKHTKCRHSQTATVHFSLWVLHLPANVQMWRRCPRQAANTLRAISASPLYGEDVVKRVKYTLKGVKFPFTSHNNVVGGLCNNMALPQNAENNHSVLPFGGGQFCWWSVSRQVDQSFYK